MQPQRPCDQHSPTKTNTWDLSHQQVGHSWWEAWCQKQMIVLVYSVFIKKRGLPSAESSRSVRGLGKGVSGKPYPRLCNAKRPRLEPGTFQSQTVRLYRLHHALHSIGTDLAKWSVCCTTNIGCILDGRNQIISIIILLLDGCYKDTFAPQRTCWSNMLVAAQMTCGTGLLKFERIHLQLPST